MYNIPWYYPEAVMASSTW